MHRRAFAAPILLTFLLLGTSVQASSQTHRRARVQVWNATGGVLNYVRVFHKYSDVYRNEQEWRHVPTGSVANGSMTVDYNTGFGTTGKDWWLVVWASERGTSSASLRYTDPQNGRAFIDGLEMVWKEVTPVVMAAAVGTACFAAGCGPAAPFAAMAGAAVSSQVFGRMMNSESTAGFKQHILRSEDARGTTTIEIRGDGSVAFVSPSGRSTTGSRLEVMQVPAPAHGMGGRGTGSHVSGPTLASLSGPYENYAYNGRGKNDWHYVTVTQTGHSTFQWSNRAGVSWTLRGDDLTRPLAVGSDSPYYANGHRHAAVEWNNDGTVRRIQGPGGEWYDRVVRR